jgi:hypothetical protein
MRGRAVAVVLGVLLSAACVHTMDPQLLRKATHHPTTLYPHTGADAAVLCIRVPCGHFTLYTVASNGLCARLRAPSWPLKPYSFLSI